MHPSLNLDPAFLLSSRAYGLKRENVIWVKRIVAGVWSERGKCHFGSKELSLAYGLKKGKTPFRSKELSRAYGLKGKNAIWVKRIVAGVWSRGNSHFGSKERFIRITGYKMRMY